MARQYGSSISYFPYITASVKLLEDVGGRALTGFARDSLYANEKGAESREILGPLPFL